MKKYHVIAWVFLVAGFLGYFILTTCIFHDTLVGDKVSADWWWWILAFLISVAIMALCVVFQIILKWFRSKYDEEELEVRKDDT